MDRFGIWTNYATSGCKWKYNPGKNMDIWIRKSTVCKFSTTKGMRGGDIQISIHGMSN